MGIIRYKKVQEQEGLLYMFASSLACRSCGSLYPVENVYACSECGGTLDVRYDYPDAFNAITSPDGRFSGLWKYRAMLPVKDTDNIVTLGEGDTPLIDVPRIAGLWGCGLRIAIKAESLNPSGSFKDRPCSVGVSMAKELGYRKVVLSSSGNASAAAAAYAARAGMECVVFIPDSTDPNKVVQAQAYGAKVICVRGNVAKSFGMAKECASKFGWINITSTFLNPYTVEGDKTPAYELYHQLNGDVPDYILVPVSVGPLLVAIYKGYEEMRTVGLIEKMPAMIGVQAKNCEPLTRAYDRGENAVQGWPEAFHTVAAGIADPLLGYETEGDITLSVVRRSGGVMVSLTEEELLDATAVIEKRAGLYCEPSGAASVGAVKKLWERGILRRDSTAVCLVTGNGFKYSGRNPEKPPVIESVEQIEPVLTNME